MVAAAILIATLIAGISGAPHLPLAGRALLAIDGLVSIVKTIKVRSVVLVLPAILNLKF